MLDRLRTLATIATIATGASLVAGGCGADSGGSTPDTAPDILGDGSAEIEAQACECGSEDRCGLNRCGAECGVCAQDAVCLGGDCEPASACDHVGMSALVQQASLVRVADEGATLSYRTDSRASAPFDRLEIQSFERYGGPTAAGIYPITDAGYADCALCVLGYRGCSQLGCAQTFLADAGTLSIDQAGGGRFEATLRDARFREVTIDPHTLTSSPVAAGQRWCVERFEASAALTERAVEDTCVPAGTGTRIGDKIADFDLKTCAGEPAHLHDRCGDARAVWVVLATGWCSSCAEHVPSVGATWERQRAIGLDAVIILGEDASGEEPTPAYCAQYAEDMGVDPSLIYIDYGATSGGFETVGRFIELYSGDSLSLPWDGVLDGRNMRYVWSGAHDGGVPADAIQPLLGK